MITMVYMHDFNKSFFQTLYQKSIDKKAEYNCIIFPSVNFITPYCLSPVPPPFSRKIVQGRGIFAQSE